MVASATSEVSRAAYWLSSRRTWATQNPLFFDDFLDLSPPAGKEGIAGSMDKPPRVDAIHSTRQTDTTDEVA